MPRKARLVNDYGTYYIKQRSNQDLLFRDDCDRNKFLSILAKTQKKYQLIIFAYCILSPNEYHLVLNTNGNKIANIMRSINISYALYRNAQDKLFKERFYSLILYDDQEKAKIIKKIHQKYQKNTSWNSYCVHVGYGKLELDISLNHNINTNKKCIHTIEEVKANLQERGNIKDIIKDKKYRNQLIKEFRKKSSLSLKELGQIFGGLSESSISKILNGKENEI